MGLRRVLPRQLTYRGGATCRHWQWRTSVFSVLLQYLGDVFASKGSAPNRSQSYTGDPVHHRHPTSRGVGRWLR